MPSLTCRCGTMRLDAVLDPPGTHVSCYCDDCRAYARWLGRLDLLDAHGGTEIVQLAPAQLRITSGAERLACLRLSQRGLFRFFASCCKTPLGNSIPRVPFIGVVCGGIGLRPASTPLGVQGRFALGGKPASASARAPLGLIARSVFSLARRALDGSARPSPFFDEDGVARCAIHVLRADERSALADP